GPALGGWPACGGGVVQGNPTPRLSGQCADGQKASSRLAHRRAATPSPCPPPGPRTLAWLLLRRPSDLDEKEQHLLQELCQRSPELVNACQLAQQFLRLVRERPGGRELDSWSPQSTTRVRQNCAASAEISNATGP